MDKSYKVFVGGLPVRVEREVIAEFFASYGTVLNCKLKKNQQTGRSLGFAYLTVKEKSTYDRLLSESVIFQGRVIDVKPMWKKKELGEKLEEEKKRKIFVSNLPTDLTNPELMAFFSKFGQVANAFIIKDPDTTGHKDYGYVIFRDESAVRAATRQTELWLHGRLLAVEVSTNVSQIAISKQSSSLRHNQAPTAPLKTGDSPYCPVNIQGTPGISVFASVKSTASQGKEATPKFNLFGGPNSTSLKPKGLISRFCSGHLEKFAIGGAKFTENARVPEQVQEQSPTTSNKLEKSSFIIKASDVVNSRLLFTVDLSSVLSSKAQLLEKCTQLKEHEDNYSFHVARRRNQNFRRLL